MNYRAIILCAVIGALTACHSRPVVEQPIPTRPEPEPPIEAPPPSPPLEDRGADTAQANSDAVNATPPCLPEVAKPKAPAKHRPRPAQDTGKPAPAEPPSPHVSAAPEVKPIEAPVASILGQKVQGANGEDLGRVVDVQADASGRVRLVIIEYGGFLGVGIRRTAIDWGLLRFHPDDPERPISLSVSGRQVQGTPEYRQTQHPKALMAPPPVPAAPPEPAPAPAPPASNPPQSQAPPTNPAPPQTK